MGSGKPRKKLKASVVTERMSPGERMVWAAAFASKLDISSPPSSVFQGAQDNSEWAEWEQAQTKAACEYASSAVLLLRETLPDVMKGWEGLDTAQWMEEMVNG